MVTVQWHLIIYIIIMLILLRYMFTDGDGLDFTPVFAVFGMVVLTFLYGGIFWW